jgi:hypothetical protein
MLFPRSVLREEEEWGGGNGRAYYSSDDLRSVDQWWREIETAAPKFPLYATFLATKADSQTASFIEAHRPELKEIAGPNCCFVYFRDYNAVQRLGKWDYSEHGGVVVPLAGLIGVTIEQLPCLVFFKRFTAGEFWRVDLRNLPSGELMARMRQIFSHIRPDAEDPLRALMHYDWLSVWQRTGDMLKDAFKEVAQKSPQTCVDLQRVLDGHFYSCFISYSNHDETFAKRLHSDLVDRNLRCWFAPKDLKPGEFFQERIEESIRDFDKLMIVLSEASVHSRWVEREVNAALEREDREKHPILFPIRIDDAVMEAPQPWVAHIRRTRHIGDFRGSYQQAFDQLLWDLKAPDRGTGQPA